MSSFGPTYVKRVIFLLIYGQCTTLMSLNANFFLIPVEPTRAGDCRYSLGKTQHFLQSELWWLRFKFSDFLLPSVSSGSHQQPTLSWSCPPAPLGVCMLTFLIIPQCFFAYFLMFPTFSLNSMTKHSSWNVDTQVPSARAGVLMECGHAESQPGG